MAKIEIYTKDYCPYCTRALALLADKATTFADLAVQQIKIDGDMALRETMITRSNGSYTVPQIFINDAHVGGCDELLTLNMQNKLDALLTTA